MKVVDAMTGIQLRIGFPVPLLGGSVTLLQVNPGFFSARALIRYQGLPNGSEIPNGDRWVDLAVRFTHPKYFLQHVGFIPS